MMFTFVENDKSAKIKVIGVGGAGGNAINNMIDSKLRGIKFIAVNTDSQALDISKAPIKIQIGDKITEGLGAGADPQVGREAALENADAIRESLEDSHMVFITAGFGGGTGTGATPVIAEICKEMGALTVAVVTKPFGFEGKKRMEQAEEGLKALKGVANAVITIPNDRLRRLGSRNDTMLDMFKRADEILLRSVKGITDLLMLPGLINLDFADVMHILDKAGMALMGTGIASGENRALKAAERAISHPLLEDVSVAGARGVLMNLTSGTDLTMAELTEASDIIYEEAGDGADIIWGAVLDDSMGDELRVTVIVTWSEREGEPMEQADRFRPTSGGYAAMVQYELDAPSFMQRQRDTLELVAVEQSEVWERGYSIFRSMSNETQRSQKLKEYRKAVLADTATSDDAIINQFNVFLNSLWRLSKSTASVPEHATTMVKLMKSARETEVSTALRGFYNFIENACHISSADDITTMLTTFADNAIFSAETTSKVDLPHEIGRIDEIITILSSTLPSDSPRNLMKKIVSKLHELSHSIQSQPQTPEIVCLDFVAQRWIRLIEKALRTSFGKLSCRLITAGVIYVKRWNKIELEILGGPDEESFQICAPFTQEYEVELIETKGTFHKSAAVIQLRVKPYNQGPLNLLLEIEGITCQTELLSLPLNPFVVGIPVQSDEMFLGRSYLVDRIIRGLSAPNPIPFLITGRRRIGKTSLLYAVKRASPPGMIPVYISTEISGKTLPTIYQMLANEIKNAFKEMDIVKVYQNLPITISREDPSSSLISWFRVLHKLSSQESIHRIILLIDEALVVTQLDEQAQALFRYVFSNMHWIGGVLASPPDIIARMTGNASSPLYNIFTTEKLGPLSEQDSRELISKPLRQYGIRNLDYIADRVHSYSGGIPFYIQAIGYELIENSIVNKIEGEELLERSLTAVPKKLQTSYPVTLDKLPPEQKITIVSIARNIKPPEVCAQRLAEADLVEKDGEAWVIRAEIERDWVRLYTDSLLDSAGKDLWDRYGENIDLPQLAQELRKVQRKLQGSGEKSDALVLATEAAEAGNGAKALTCLGRAGRWALDTATKIGTEVATAAIKASHGL